VVTGVGGCSRLKGIYADQTGTITLDIDSSDTAKLTFGGEVYPCTYTKDDNELTMNCKGLAAHNVTADRLSFTVHDDETLTSSQLPVPLTKKK